MSNTRRALGGSDVTRARSLHFSLLLHGVQALLEFIGSVRGHLIWRLSILRPRVWVSGRVTSSGYLLAGTIDKAVDVASDTFAQAVDRLETAFDLLPQT